MPHYPVVLTPDENGTVIAEVPDIDLDGMNWVNDNFGHPVGDAFLRDAGIFCSDIAEQHCVDAYRTDGDETMICTKLKQPRRLRMLSEAYPAKPRTGLEKNQSRVQLHAPMLQSKSPCQFPRTPLHHPIRDDADKAIHGLKGLSQLAGPIGMHRETSWAMPAASSCPTVSRKSFLRSSARRTVEHIGSGKPFPILAHSMAWIVWLLRLLIPRSSFVREKKQRTQPNDFSQMLWP